MTARHERPTLLPHTLLACLLVASTLAGCLRPRDAAPVARAGLRSAAALGAAYERDLGALRAMAGALLAIDRERVRLEAERSIVTHCLTATGEVDPDSLDNSACALAHSVEHGAMSAAQARAWLRTYADALREGDDDARESLVAQLLVVREHADASGALLDALDMHARRVALVAADAGASAALLAEFASFDAPEGDAARAHAEAIWSAAPLERIDDAGRRAAAERLLARVLDIALPATDDR